MGKQIIKFNCESHSKTKKERASETYKILAGVIKNLTVKLKALRVFIENLSNGAPNYEFKIRVQELLQCILSSCKNEYSSNVHNERITKLFMM